MISSKPWNWKMLNDESKKIDWLEPSIESYYLIDRWKKQNKNEFLDIGCGLGRHSIQFAKSGFSVTSIDLSLEALNYLEKWSNKEKLEIELLYADMMNLPFEKDSFDCILCRNVISHTDTEGMYKIVDCIYNLLKNDGECFLSLGSKNSEIFLNENNPLLDENTRIRMDKGPEYGVPHFYADMKIIPDLFKKFKIEYLAHTNDFKPKEDGGFRSFWHYYLLIKKI